MAYGGLSPEASRAMRLNIASVRYWMIVKGMDGDADLARATGWSKATVSRVLNGKLKGMKPMRLAQLAVALGRPEADLVELDDVAQTPFQRMVLERLKGGDSDAEAIIRVALKIPSSVPNSL